MDSLEDTYDLSDDSYWVIDNESATPPVLPIETEISVIGVKHWMALTCYGLVVLLGVPGNLLVAWVTAFRMPNSVNAQWFLHLALADLLCCLSLPLLMVPLAQDQHWPFGSLACKVLHGVFYTMMYCSVLLLVVISLDRLLLVTQPVWCQNKRRPKEARCVCVVVWVVALLSSSPQFAFMDVVVESKSKTVCVSRYSSHAQAWSATICRCFLSFLLPFLAICISHWKVYQLTKPAPGQRVRDKSGRTLRVILAVVFSFFMCWTPLHTVDIMLLVYRHVTGRIQHDLRLAQVLTLCLAYINSCLNPLLYVCLGRGFKKTLVESLRSVLHFASEGPVHHISLAKNTKSTSDGVIRGKTMTVCFNNSKDRCTSHV